ncbi:MAG: serine/threonine protein kinase [Acidobacteria bacterium]|nr:serine/threonine protein kinase [Acidobacteriota bacterium]
MKPRTAEEIYLELGDHTGDGRRRFLEEACGGDADLLRQVELLESRAAALDEGLRSAIRDQARCEQGRRRIGPYRVVRSLGHGGMGTVYLAVRDDDEYQKYVAIKVARAVFAAEADLTRFRHERQILAALEHPNIARLLEGGTTPDGEPYIVMEYVDGVAITGFQAGFEVRLRLLLKVAAAVEYAHHHLIVHRDIKPSNILVTAGGEPKLLDFGIAKTLDVMQGSAFTETPLMTRDYSSPEQLAGKPVTIGSDVFSLGVVFCEVLTGRRDAAALRGDLQSVAEKAIHPNPGLRYRSIREFTDDVERFLAGHPVWARPASHLYKIRKFLGRHRGPAAVAALLLVSVGIGWWSTLRESRRAQMRLTQVRQMANTMLFDVHDRIQPLPGSIEARASLVETAQKYLGSLESSAAEDSTVASEIATGYERLGDLQGGAEMASIGRVGAAVESYRRSLALRERLATDAATFRDLSRVQVKTANAMAQRGASAEAFDLLRRGTASAQAALRFDPASRESGRVVMEAEYRIGDWLLRKGRAAEALPHASNSLEMARRTGVDLSAALRRFGDAAHQGGRLDQAASAFREAAEERRRERGGMDREGMLLELALGNVLGNPLFLNMGDADAAGAHYKRALEWARTQWDRDPANAGARADYAAVLSRLASTYWDRNPAESIRLYDLSIAVRQQQSNAAPENVEFIRILAYDLANSSNPLRRAGRPAEALRRVQRALELDAEMVRRDPVRVECCSDVPLYSVALGNAQWTLGQKAEAGRSFLHAAAVAESYGVRDTCGVFCTKDWAASLNHVAAWHAAMNRPGEARQWVDRARAVWKNWIARNGSNPDIEKRLSELGSPLR